MNAFIRMLRTEGFTIGISEVGDIHDLLGKGAVPSRADAWHILRALTCRSRSEWLAFDRHFRRFWFPEEILPEEYTLEEKLDPRLRVQSRVSGIAGASSEDPDSIYGDANLRGTGAGNQRSITRTDYRFLNDQQAMRKVERLAEQLALRLKRRRSRRRRLQGRGSRLDIRRTLRRNLATGGFPVRRLFAVPRTEPLDLVIFHDISHSMAWNNPLLFRFARGLVRAFDRAEAFAFHTSLFPVTDIYRQQSIDTMRAKLESNNRLWMGGTRIGESLAAFHANHARRVLKPASVVIVISDGFDSNDPGLLLQALDELKAGCRKIIWLNPMLGREGVTTTAEELSDRFPQVDQFLPANSLEALTKSLDQMV